MHQRDFERTCFTIRPFLEKFSESAVLYTGNIEQEQLDKFSRILKCQAKHNRYTSMLTFIKNSKQGN